MSGPDHQTKEAPEADDVLVGWREWVRMPEHEIPWIKAKVDTGARTSSLHAFDVEESAVDGRDQVRFTVRPWQASDEDVATIVLPVHDRRRVRSSSGHVEERLVVLMGMTMGRRRFTAEVTLTDRDEMGFRMLVGRQALEQGFLVDSRVSYAGPRPLRAIRKKNWGKA